MSYALCLTVAKFAAGNLDTVVHLTCAYLQEFSKKFELTPKLSSGALGKMIHLKKHEEKNLVTLSLPNNRSTEKFNCY
jgi:hypothetical protein